MSPRRDYVHTDMVSGGNGTFHIVSETTARVITTHCGALFAADGRPRLDKGIRRYLVRSMYCPKNGKICGVCRRIHKSRVRRKGGKK